ncbi:MAG: sulfite exporter TauE/SafE family protein [Stappiaceae bacterium]
MDIESLWMLAALVFLLAGAIKGLVGIGLPTAVIGVLSQFTDPRQAIALLILPVLISNIWQVHKNRMFRKSLVLFWPFSITMAVGIWYFTQFAASVSSTVLSGLVGGVMMVFVFATLFTQPFSIASHLDKPVQIFAGSIAGVMGGLTSLWAPPMLIYLMSQPLKKDEFVGALGFLILAGTIPLAGGYIQAGLTSPTVMVYSAAMTVPTLVGVSIGEYGRKFLNGDQFRSLLLLIFFLLGANLIRISIF